MNFTHHLKRCKYIQSASLTIIARKRKQEERQGLWNLNLIDLIGIKLIHSTKYVLCKKSRGTSKPLLYCVVRKAFEMVERMAETTNVARPPNIHREHTYWNTLNFKNYRFITGSDAFV